MWDFIKNMIPWWVYLILIVAGAGILWVYFGPLLLAIWSRLPAWAKYVIGLLLAIGLSVVYGRNKGFADARERQKKLDEKAVQKRQEIHNEVSKLDTTQLDKRLDKWMRD